MERVSVTVPAEFETRIAREKSSPAVRVKLRVVSDLDPVSTTSPLTKYLTVLAGRSIESGILNVSVTEPASA